MYQFLTSVAVLIATQAPPTCWKPVAHDAITHWPQSQSARPLGTEQILPSVPL